MKTYASISLFPDKRQVNEKEEEDYQMSDLFIDLFC